MIDDAVEFNPWMIEALNYSYRVACAHIGSSQGQDVVQESMLRLSTKSIGFTEQPPGENGIRYWFLLLRETGIRKWAARKVHIGMVTKHTAINTLREKTRRGKRDAKYFKAEEQRADSTSPFVAAFDDEDVQACVERLPEPFKTCYVRDYRPGPMRTEEDASSEDGCTKDAVKHRRRRYKELLRDCLKRRGLGDGGAE